jgi:hypothetical protein
MPKVFILFLGSLALVIIISAAFNYTSLSVARSQVIIQFLSEAVVIAVISLILTGFIMLATVDKLEETWDIIDPDQELNGEFLDERIRFYYTFFEDIMCTVGFATLLAISTQTFKAAKTKPATTLKNE